MAQIALITGGTMGIGLALAGSFLKRGYSVAVCGRSEAALESFAARYPAALAIRADVTLEGDRAAMLQEIASRFGRIDVLVNNAGSFVERDFAKGGEEATMGLDQEVALNLTAPIQLTREVLDRWAPLKGIVFVTSGFALVSPTRAPTYGAVKAGLHAFADGLRGQLASQGTQVLEVLPPATDTRMNANNPARKIPPEQVAEAALKALEQRKEMALPGDVRMLPLLLRLAPKAVRRMVSRY